jgi:hypothetical protein
MTAFFVRGVKFCKFAWILIAINITPLYWVIAKWAHAIYFAAICTKYQCALLTQPKITDF